MLLVGQAEGMLFSGPPVTTVAAQIEFDEQILRRSDNGPEFIAGTENYAVTWPPGLRRRTSYQPAYNSETNSMPTFEKRLACVIKSDGTVARGYMIDKCELKGENEYLITWKIPLQGEAKTNFAGTIGSALEEEVQPGFITVGLTQDPSQMQVHTYDVSGKPARRSFHIACFRDE